MLLSLLRRDLILHWQATWPVIAIFAAFQIYFVLNVNSPGPWVVFTSIYLSFITVTPMTREEKFRALTWACTLPVSRAELVRARYVSAWALVAGSYFVALVLAAAIPGSRLASALPVDVDSLLLAATIVSILMLGVLPFTIRFGLMGLVIVLGAIQMLGALLLIVGATMGTMGAIEGGVAAVFRPIISTVRNLRAGMGLPMFQLLAVLTLLAVNWAGYRLALALFRRKEL